MNTTKTDKSTFNANAIPNLLAADFETAKEELNTARRTTLRLHSQMETAHKNANEAVKLLDAAGADAEVKIDKIAKVFEAESASVRDTETTSTAYDLCMAVLNGATNSARVIDLLRAASPSIIHEMASFANTVLDFEQRKLWFAEYNRAYATIRRAYKDYNVVPNYYMLSDDGDRYRYLTLKLEKGQVNVKETSTKPFTESKPVNQAVTAFELAVAWAKIARAINSEAQTGDWVTKAEACRDEGVVHGKASERMLEVYNHLVFKIRDYYTAMIELDIKNIPAMNRVKLEQTAELVEKSTLFDNAEVIEAIAARRLVLGEDAPKSSFDMNVEGWLDQFESPEFDMKALMAAVTKYNKAKKQA